ncbi:MAG TPA: hypothetical protein VFN67_31870 [Polyangiales bacterium]|nr:hypothetical protein [Polyangiales bacterium]
MTAPDLEQIARGLRSVNGADHPRALSLLASQTLAAMADAHTLDCDRPLLRSRAARLKLKGAHTRTEHGDLLAMLEEGPRDADETACLSAFAASGFITSLTELPSGERSAMAERWVARLDWIELATDFRIVACLRQLLMAADSDVVSLWRRALFQAVLRDDNAVSGVDARTRAKNALRVTALSQVQGEESVLLLRSLRDCARDPSLRTLAVTLLAELVGRDAAHGTPLRVSGVARSPSRSLPMALVRWLSGFALLSAAQRLLFTIVSLRRELEIELREEALCVRWHTSFFGKTLRSSEACYELQRVTGAFRRARFAMLSSLISVLSLSLGVFLGGFFLFDGARGGAPMLFLIGSALIALGAAVDLALNVWWPARHARVDLQVDLHGAPSLRVGHVVQAEADRMLDALSLRLSRGAAAERR